MKTRIKIITDSIWDYHILCNGMEYRTNNEGNGLFVKDNNHWRQVDGTCDFSVANVKNKIAKLSKRVREREYVNPFED